jgi:hypothetical protein
MHYDWKLFSKITSNHMGSKNICTFVGIVHEELVKQLMVQRLLLCCSIRKNVLMSNIVQTWDCIQTTTTVLVSKERHSFRLSPLQFKQSQYKNTSLLALNIPNLQFTMGMTALKSETGRLCLHQNN